LARRLYSDSLASQGRVTWFSSTRTYLRLLKYLQQVKIENANTWKTEDYGQDDLKTCLGSI
jgi:hypothetical protein